MSYFMSFDPLLVTSKARKLVGFTSLRSITVPCSFPPLHMSCPFKHAATDYEPNGF